MMVVPPREERTVEDVDRPSAAPQDPEQLEASAAPATGEIAPATHMGAVELTVSDVQRSRAFYESVLGLEPLETGAGVARLGAGGRELLRLVEVAGAQPATGYCGLYHVAYLLPERRDLARWLAHAARERIPLTGLSDHDVSEAIYLDDPDHHGIEVYWDRPREQWEGMVDVRMTTLPLDVQSLLGELENPAAEPFEGAPAGTTIGHVHMRVADIEQTVAFYRDALGMGLMAQLGRQAAFLAAGGYHHHIGANTWESAGAPPAPEGTATLRHASVVLPDAAARDRTVDSLAAAGHAVADTDDGPLVRDPSGNALVLLVD
jgi:catechol 2,3-dioxygenase